MSGERGKDVLFFDLDGTLIDSQVGITACIAYALQKMEYPVPPQDTLRTLHGRGHRLAVVTAKNEPHARRILAHLPFGGLFEEIVGSTLDGSRSHKPELVGEALRRLQVQPAQCWMIGDRRMDIEGARHHGLRSVGVLWGFGGEAELTEAGAGQLASEPAQLETLLA